jgi:murein DD-endopeptidase MepM/ murein hydrolase activator NlpD
MGNEELHRHISHRSNAGFRFAHASRYAAHSVFLLILAAATIIAASQLAQPLTTHALQSEAATQQAAGLVKSDGFMRVASPFKVYVDDNVIRRNYVPTERSSDAITPNNEKVTPRTLLTYTVQSGDTLFGIAGAFGLAPETVLWSNYRVLKDNPELLGIGLDLIIPPSDGLITEAEVNDTVDTLAQRYKVTPRDIVAEPLNGLAAIDQALPTGVQLFIPGGKRELVIWEVTKPVEVRRNATTGVRVYSVGTCGEVTIPPLGTGSFVYPTGHSDVSGYDFTSTHPGVDFAGDLGVTIYAADSGTVIFSGDSVNAMGQYIGYGKYIVIDHGNGFQTLYAHASQSYVTCGQQVLRGSVIAAVGSTGNSTGPHLHFEIRNNRLAVNPWNLLPPR